MTTALWRAVAVLAGVGAVAVVVGFDAPRPVLVAGGLATAACAVAAVTAWRFVGTVALVLVTVTVLLADALDSAPARPWQTLAAAVLLVAQVTALDRAEDPPGPGAVTVQRAPTASRLAVPLLGLGGAVLVSLAGTRDVAPSVPLVLAGAGCAVAALVVAVQGHRNRPGGPDVRESLSVRAPDGPGR